MNRGKIMTLDEAIKHSLEVANNEDTCEECREQCIQLAEWLMELKEYKQKDKVTWILEK